MGCSQYSKMSSENSIVSKQRIIQIIKTETNNMTMSGTNLILKTPSLKLCTQPEKVCVKIQLTKSFSTFIIENISGFESFSEKLYDIRKYWILFRASKGYFESQVHRVCISKYKIDQGLMVLLISTVASRSFDAICINQSPPYLTFKGKFQNDSEKIIKAWEDLSNFMKVVVDGKIDDKIETYSYFLNEYLNGCPEDEVEYVKMAIKSANDFIDEFREINTGVKMFLANIKEVKAQINFYATCAADLNIFSAKSIVHKIIR